jgi:hypothetical protein
MKPLPFFLFVLLMLPAAVQAQFNYTTVYYTTVYGEITITGYTGSAGEVDIPNFINGFPVTSIGPGAFYQHTGLTSIVISNNLTSIGDGAFNGCSSLTNITWGGSVNSIGIGAFQNCTNLKSIMIPDSVSSIGFSSFNGCSGLTNLIIGIGVTNVPEGAFSSCASLTSVAIPGNVINIGDYAFFDCTNLADVTISNGVVGIGNDTFSDCALSSITIPDSVTSIGDQVFDYCPNFTSITVESSNSVFSSTNGVLFNKNQTSLVLCPECISGSYIMPNTVTDIGDDAFFNCGSLTNISIDNAVINIESNAFAECWYLMNITIPSNVVNVDGSAFDFCISLTEINVDTQNPNYSSTDGVLYNKNQSTLIRYPPGSFNGFYDAPNSVTNMLDYAFADCSLTNIAIPDSVTSVDAQAFDDCFELEAITVDAENPFYSSVNGVLLNKSQSALVRCPPGETGNYTIPGSVTNIESGAFYECEYLNNVVIGSGVTEIGTNAFNFCGMTNVIIPDNVQAIDDSAFISCYNLTGVEIGNGVTNIGNSAFNGCGSLTSVKLGENVNTIGEYAFSFCNDLTNIIIGKNVTALGNTAFAFSTNLSGGGLKATFLAVAFMHLVMTTKQPSITCREPTAGERVLPVFQLHYGNHRLMPPPA